MNALENPLKVQSKKLQHGFQPVYYFSRCVGLWPFSITYHSNGSIKAARVRLFDVLWFFISICVYLATLSYYFERMKAQERAQKHYLSDLIYYTSQITFLSFTAVGIVLDMFNRKRLVDILDKFANFDSSVSISNKHRSILYALS